jgi:hypothetical protein
VFRVQGLGDAVQGQRSRVKGCIKDPGFRVQE